MKECRHSKNVTMKLKKVDFKDKIVSIVPVSV